MSSIGDIPEPTTSETSVSSIGDIPDALLLLVLRQASRRTVTRTFLVCRKWAEAFLEYACNASIRGSANLDPPGVAGVLQQFHYIQDLRFRGDSILSDELLRTIAATCPHLLSLRFDEYCCVWERDNPTATEAGLDAIFIGCPELRHIVLRGFGALVLPDSLSLLTNLESLEVLPLGPEIASDKSGHGGWGHDAWGNDLMVLFSGWGSAPRRGNWPPVLRSPRLLAAFRGSPTPSLPPSLVDLCRLKTLALDYRNIRELPADIGSLTRLRKLWLKCASLASLPDTACQLTGLKDMFLYSEELSELPQNLGEMSSLTRLDLQTESLVSLPHSSTLSLGRSPNKLMVCARLTELPQSFCALPELADLTIALCGRLVSLPEGFGRLPSLAKLTIANCGRLEHLPSDFGNLRALKNLHLAGLARLRALPASFGQLYRLEWLSIRVCLHLSSLSEGFGDLSALHTLDLDSLPALQNQPPSFQSLSFNAERHITAEEPLNEIQNSLDGVSRGA